MNRNLFPDELEFDPEDTTSPDPLRNENTLRTLLDEAHQQLAASAAALSRCSLTKQTTPTSRGGWLVTELWTSPIVSLMLWESGHEPTREDGASKLPQPLVYVGLGGEAVLYQASGSTSLPRGASGCVAANTSHWLEAQRPARVLQVTLTEGTTP